MAADEAGTEEIFNIFTKDEKDVFSEPIKKKLGGFWLTKSKEITRLKIENDKIKINADQEKFNLERELVTLKNELDEERVLREEASQARESNDKRISELEEKFGEANKKVVTLTKELEQSQNEQECVTSQSAAMAGIMENRALSIKDLYEQVNLLEEQLKQASRLKCDAIMKAEEASSKELKAQYREKRLEQEKALISRQVEVLQQQVKDRVEENLDLRREHASQSLNLQASLKLCAEELRVAKEELALNRNQLDEKSQRITDLLASLNAARESEIKLDEMYREELGAQKKLAEIYEGSAKDEEERCQELEKGLEEHRHLLQSASDQYGLLERKKQKMEEEHQAEVERFNEVIKKMQNEIDKANALLTSSAKMDSSDVADHPTNGSATSKVMNRGMSMTQVYSEYLTAKEKLHATEEENKQLQRYIDGILAEIEARVPVFRKQREDQQKALDTINSLHDQLEKGQSRLEKQSLECQEGVRKNNYLEKELERTKQELKDVSMQVTVLITQVEAARLGQAPPPVPRDLANMLSSDDVVSDRLIVFRNVSELQDQNKKLRASLRKLSKDIDTDEMMEVGGKTKELEEELRYAKTKLSEMQDQRERQENLLENVIKQRDMYKIQCNERSPRAPKTPPTKQSSSMFGVSQEEVHKMQKELEETLKKLEESKKEHEEYREQSKKNNQSQQDEYNRLRSRMDKTLSENVKLLSQAEFNEERLKALTHNSEVLQRQVAALQNNNSALQGMVGRHEANMEAQRKEFMCVQKEYSRCQIIIENMREEIKMLKDSETRMLAEREFNSQSQAALSIVLANQETIKNNLERTDNERTIRLENQVQELTEKCSRMQTKLEANTDLKEAQSKLNISEGKIKSLKTETRHLNKELNAAKAELITLHQRLKDHQEERIMRAPITSPAPAREMSPMLCSSSTPVGLTSTPMRSRGPQLRDLQVQLNEEKANSQSIQTSLDEAKKQIGELIAVTKQQEKQLKDSSETYQELQDQFKRVQKARDELDSMIPTLQSQLSNMTSDSENVKSRLETMLSEAKEKVEATEKRLKESNESFQKAKDQEEQARKEALAFNEKSEEIQDKYEKEVMMHGTDIKTLAELKKKQADFDAELQKATLAKTKAEEAVRDTRLGFEKRENVLRRENKDLMVRAHELEEQNKSLLDKFTELSDKMAAIQTKLASSSLPSGDGDANMSFSEDEARSSDQLREVIKYLRREREVTTGKCEVAEAEAQQLIAQKRLLESRIESLTKDLAEERVKSNSSMNSASNYSELLRKVNTVEALSDSNRLMREEKEFLESKLKEYKAKAEALEKQIEPMNEGQKESLTQIEALMLEKKNIESEKDLFKKRTEELVVKLNQAKPEDIIKIQQDYAEQQKTLQDNKKEIEDLKSQLQQVQQNLEETITQKNQLNDQLQSSIEEARQNAEEIQKLCAEKTRVQQQIAEENKKYTMEKNKLQLQMAQTQERLRTVESTAQQMEANHLQEMRNIQEQLSREKEQIQENKEQVLESKGREDQLKHQMEIVKKEMEEVEAQLEEEKARVAEYQAKAEKLEENAIQLRKIAHKYKKQAESTSDTAPGSPPDEDEESVLPSPEKVKELEDNIQALCHNLEEAQEECHCYQQEISELKETIEAKEEELQDAKEQGQQREEQIFKLRSEMEVKRRELQSSVNRLEECQNKKQVLEKDTEILNKKLQTQQEQIENLQKQSTATLKASTSGVAAEKGSGSPPTANVKPLNPPVSPSASNSLQQTASQVAPPSKPIPTASIRPMAPPPPPPPSGGSAPSQGSTVGVVSPSETHSDGMVSSTVTLAQATVTPTPAISSPTLLTTTTTTPASTLTATMSPTQVSVTKTAAPTTATIPSQTPTATQSTSVSQSSGAQSANAMEVSDSNTSGACQSGSMASQSTINNKSVMSQQPSTGSTSPVLGSQITAGSKAASSKSPGDVNQQQDNSQDSSSSEGTGSSGINVRKRKGDSSPYDEREVKRSCVEDDEDLSSEEEAGPSSSHAPKDIRRKDSHVSESDDVILLDSDEEERPQHYPDDDDEQMEDHDHRGSARATDSEDDEMEHKESSFVGFEVGRVTREAEGSLGTREAEAEAASRSTSGNRRDQPDHRERPQSSPGPSQPSSSGQGNEASSQINSRPRPVAGQEREGGVSRQNLTFAQLPQYEDAGGDDSIVPSTPTLFVPRRDGFPEAVSSPQVPSSGFVFGPNQRNANSAHSGGLAQMAEGGLIDDTRIDLGQLDDAHRSHPTTPIHRSPTGGESGVSTSEGSSSSRREPPTVVITGAEQSNDEESRSAGDHYTEADSMAVAEEEIEDEEEEEGEHEDEAEEEEEAGEEEEEEDHREDEDDEHEDIHSEGRRSSDSEGSPQRGSRNSDHSSSFRGSRGGVNRRGNPASPSTGRARRSRGSFFRGGRS